MKTFLSGAILIALLCVAEGTRAATVTVQGNVTIASCTLNDGQDIEVPFGNDVVTTKIDGKSYKKMLLKYTFQCDTGIGTGAVLTLSISGTQASFGSGLLLTNMNGLGVQFLNESTALPVNTGKATFNYNSDQPPNIYAVLARDSSISLNGGAFSATATMSLDYQ
ncbi:fimbrial protein [Buttiauxella sp. B2]|uniref:fimbrial protein n=1 Tax=Buttiauxella sp. B2 TaxID=2587812 RepID=UPI001120F681|nr:fimbrial protein [Buttiauxella sp. B2]TNV10778.1 fimbrial protein [Buttiauxella sp. B2]